MEEKNGSRNCGAQNLSSLGKGRGGVGLPREGYVGPFKYHRQFSAEGLLLQGLGKGGERGIGLEGSRAVDGWNGCWQMMK